MDCKCVVWCGFVFNVFEVFCNVVYCFDVQEMVVVLSMKLGVFYNKVDGDEDICYQLMFCDVVLVMQIFGDFEIIDVLNEMFGCVVYDCVQYEVISDEVLFELLV